MQSDAVRRRVEELQVAGALLVEDGNHGEYRPRPHEFGSGNVSFIRAADMDDGRVLFDQAERISDAAYRRIRKGIGRPGDILLSHKGTVGKVALVPLDAPPFVCSPQTTLWRVLDQDRIDRAYLFAYLRSPDFTAQLRAHKGETDMADYVSLTTQRTLTVPLPPITVQRQIGRALATLEQRILLLRESSIVMERIAETVFNSWFVNYDPVRAKVTGEEPEYMDKAIMGRFPSEFIECELGLCPQGWTVGSVYDLADIVYGAPFASAMFNSEQRGAALIRIRDLINCSPAVYTSEVHPKGRLVQPGELLVGMDGEFNPTIWLGQPGWLNQRVCLIAPKQGTCAFWLKFALWPHLRFFERAKVGTTVIHLGKGDLDQIRLLIPSAAAMAAYTEIVSPILERTVQNAAQIRLLVDLRDTLLPRLISGKLRIPEAEAAVEEALS